MMLCNCVMNPWPTSSEAFSAATPEATKVLKRFSQEL
jgi:hypothetical protein